MSLESLRREIRAKADKEKAGFLKRYFKTGEGQYGHGDVFLGITVPENRKLAIKFHELHLDDVKELLKSRIHEERFIALEILDFKYNKGDEKEKREIYNFYLKNTKYINNWDLVDVSAPCIVGAYLFKNKDKKVLYNLAKSSNIWEKRMAIVSTFYFIKNNGFKDTLKISEILLNDSHDLIHKAVGWMLREVGKRDEKELERFLIKHHKNMPRTTLRYAIERFPKEKRLKYLRGEI